MESHPFSIEQVPFESPEATAIVRRAEEELDERYGPETDRLGLDPLAFTPPRGAFVVAREGDHITGGVGLRQVEEGIAEVKRLWVQPDRRRTGVARSLMAAIEICAGLMEYQTIVLETGPLQPEAVAFYRRNGWEQVDDLPVSVSCYDDSIRFLKRLS